MNDDEDLTSNTQHLTLTPLPQPDSFTSLAHEIGSFISRWIKMPSKEHTLVVGAWVIHTYLRNGEMDLIFESTPYLNVHGEKNCGKSTLMSLLRMLCFNSEEATGVDGRTLAEMLNMLRPTLFIDEIDNMLSSGSPRRFTVNLLNQGYKSESRGLPVRKNTEIVFLRVFGPKVIAGRRNGYMADTLQSRCISIPMMQKADGDKLEPFRTRDVRPLVNEIRGKIEAWVQENQRMVVRLLPHVERIPGLDNRDDEITEPLRAIAMRMGIENEMRPALIKVFAKDEIPANSDIEFLTDIHEAFQGQTRIESRVLSERLGPGFEPSRLASMLKDYCIEPKPMHMPHSKKTERGYEASDFAELLGIDVPEREDDKEEEAA